MKKLLLVFFKYFALFLMLMMILFSPSSPALALSSGETLLMTQLNLSGGDILHCTSDVDADDWQLEIASGGGTYLRPQIDGLIYEKGIDADIEDSQIMCMGMDETQYDHPYYINDTCESGTKIEETGGNGDPVETTAFSMGDEYGYGKTTLNADSGDTYAGYYWRTDLFDDVDADGVKDDAENGYLSDFNEDSYIMIGAKADWSNVSATAGDNIAEISLVFATSGTNFEVEAQITADADGNTGWTNFDDGSADNKMTFMYANCDNQFVAFYFDLSTLDHYDEDDLSSIKGLDYIDYRLIGYGDSATAELWIYYLAFVKNPAVWNYGVDKYPTITADGEKDVNNNLVPSYVAASESDGGMYLYSNDDTDLPVTTVTESSSVTSAYSNLINTQQPLQDGDKLPLNWRKFKIESDQGETNIQDDKNIILNPISSGKYKYKAEVIKNHPDGGVEVKETMYWDLSGMGKIEDSDYLLTWDSTTDKVQVLDFIKYSRFPDKIYTDKDAGDFVVSAYEEFGETRDVVDDLKSGWGDDTPTTTTEGWVSYQLKNQPDTTDGELLTLTRNVRYDGDFIDEKDIGIKEGGPMWYEKVNSLIVIGAAGASVILAVLGLKLVINKRKK